MRAIFILLLFTSMAINLLAQTPPSTQHPSSVQKPTTATECPDVAVQSFAWGVTHQRANNLDPSFSADILGDRRSGGQARTIRPPETPATTTPVRTPGNITVPTVVAGSSAETAERFGILRESYVLIKNAGNRIIRAIYWDYVFFTDSALEHELKRHKFHTKKKIAPGETKFLTEFVYRHADSAYQRIFINRVEFTDGSVWLRP